MTRQRHRKLAGHLFAVQWLDPQQRVPMPLLPPIYNAGDAQRANINWPVDGLIKLALLVPRRNHSRMIGAEHDGIGFPETSRR
jgi:hypothetical protein